jgi:hypothetical protein
VDEISVRFTTLLGSPHWGGQVQLTSTLQRFGFAALLTVAPAQAASAQTLPAGPIRAFDGRVLVTGEVVATIGAEDTDAFFNYTNYEHNALRLFRLGIAATWQPASRIAFVGEARTEDLDQAQAYAAYVRVRPWTDRAFDIQVGRIPPTFGAFGRRSYSTDNPLIGYPLAYQYLTSIHPDAIPATASDLIRMRARGWRSTFPVGNTTPSPGVPLVSGFRWDTGVQAHWSGHSVDVAGSVTAGTLSDPRFSDNNGGRQLSARVAVTPMTGLVIGTSVARGEWLSDDVKHLLSDPGDYTQTAWGADAEYSRGYWLVRGELVWSRWRTPFAATNQAGVDLDALGAWIEGRYRLTPRIFSAVRVDRLGFSNIADPAQSGPAISWEAPVSRYEVAFGYYLQRNLIARVCVQHNDRTAGRVRARTYFSGQLSYWF